jgi:ABC-type antimicrobial peptide transport system permease subunit
LSLIKGQAIFRILVGSLSLLGAVLPVFRIAFLTCVIVILGKGREVIRTAGQYNGIFPALAVF